MVPSVVSRAAVACRARNMDVRLVRKTFAASGPPATLRWCRRDVVGEYEDGAGSKARDPAKRHVAAAAVQPPVPPLRRRNGNDPGPEHQEHPQATVLLHLTWHAAQNRHLI